MNVFIWFLLFFTVKFIKDCEGVQFDFCKNEYRHLGKHIWRCKERLKHNENIINVELNVNHENSQATSSIDIIDNPVYIDDPLLNNNQNNNDTNYDYDPNDEEEEHCFNPNGPGLF